MNYILYVLPFLQFLTFGEYRLTYIVIIFYSESVPRGQNRKKTLNELMKSANTIILSSRSPSTHSYYCIIFCNIIIRLSSPSPDGATTDFASGVSPPSRTDNICYRLIYCCVAVSRGRDNPVTTRGTTRKPTSVDWNRCRSACRPVWSATGGAARCSALRVSRNSVWSAAAPGRRTANGKIPRASCGSASHT